MMLLVIVRYKIQDLKETYYIFNDDITLSKTIHSYSNATIDLTTTSRLFNFTGNNDCTKKSIIQVI